MLRTNFFSLPVGMTTDIRVNRIGCKSNRKSLFHRRQKPPVKLLRSDGGSARFIKTDSDRPLQEVETDENYYNEMST